MSNNTNNAIIAQIISNVTGSTPELINQLIEATNGTGCKLVSLRGYSSDATDNTEVANHRVNIRASYENMKTKDADLLLLVDTNAINVNDFNYGHIDTVKLTLDEYKLAVKAALPNALHEMIISANTEAAPRVSNDIWLNSALVFNTNTNSLSIFGQSISKTVEVAGEPQAKKKSKANTVAKELIRAEVARIKNNKGLSTATLRRFKVSNLSTLKINGEEIEIA